MDRIYTGFKKLDEKLRIYKGDLVVVASRPVNGRTCFITSIIKNTLNTQNNLLFSMQLCDHKAIKKFSNFNLNGSKNFEIVQSLIKLDELILKTAEFKLKNCVDVVFIDNFVDFLKYSQLSSEYVIFRLKEIALKLNVAIIVTEDLKRNETSYYTYWDISNKEFLKDADKILTMYKLDLEFDDEDLELNCIDKGTTSICIDKNMSSFFSEEVRFTFDRDSFRYFEI